MKYITEANVVEIFRNGSESTAFSTINTGNEIQVLVHDVAILDYCVSLAGCMSAQGYSVSAVYCD